MTRFKISIYKLRYFSICEQESVKKCNLYLNSRTAKGFPGGTVVENLPANAGDTGSSPGLGRSHMPRSN